MKNGIINYVHQYYNKKYNYLHKTIIMKTLKIGKLILNKKAIAFILFCLFLNGLLIGTMVAFGQDSSKTISPILILALMLAPYILFYKIIGRNIKGVK